MDKVAAIMNDLMFMSKVKNTAGALGMTVRFVQNASQLDDVLKDCGLVIIDLENEFLEPVGLIEKLKKNPLAASIKTVGYLSHTNVPLKARAISAGCDKIFSRFEFSSNLKEILQSHCF